MARVTIEDCTKYINSRFELVVLAAQRAKEIAAGAPVTIKKEDDKNAVMALREIGAGNINVDTLRESVIKKFQKRQAPDNADKPEDDMNEDRMEISKDMELVGSNEADNDSIYKDEDETEELTSEN